MPKYDHTKEVTVNIVADHLFDLPTEEELPGEDKSYLRSSRASILAVQILSMFEKIDPPPEVEEQKQPELARLSLIEENRVSPYVDSVACGILGIPVVEFLMFKRNQLWREKQQSQQHQIKY